jgi:molybdate-binding protein
MVAKGNPLRIFALADLTRPNVRFVNRQRGSGTRILVEGLLRSVGIDSRAIHGHDTGEFTHAAVAAFVASGMADVGFGIEPAARQFKLDFIPLVKERYMLLGKAEALRQAPVQELVTLLKGPEFLELMRPVAGYDLDNPGAVCPVKEVLPWAKG